ncbi:MAG: hypothetical protein JXA30_04120 [Deltaproteobacteria bacterium]|nr:hypothetical protein [Deltaproteobacteria bacterium]
MPRRLAFLFYLISLHATPLAAQEGPPDDQNEQSSDWSAESSPVPVTETQGQAISAPDSTTKQDSSLSEAAAEAEPMMPDSRTVHTVQPSSQTASTPPRQSKPAQAPPPKPSAAEEDWGQYRVLGGHQFPAAIFVPLALSSSYLGVRAGIQYHSVPGFASLPTLGNGQVQQFADLETVNVAENIDFSLRLHDYVAVFGDAYGEGRVGANIATLLGTGADYTYGGDLGALVKIVRIGGFQLAIRGQVGFYAGQSAGVLALFEDLTDIAIDALSRILGTSNFTLNSAIEQLNTSFAAATADLLTPFDGLAYGTSLNVALALGKYIGFQGSLGFLLDTTSYRPTNFDAVLGSPVTFERTERSLRPSVSAAIDFDASPVGLPIDIIVEYRFTPITVERENENGSFTESSIESLIALGIYYSGRTDLQLGVTGYTLLGQAPTLGVNGLPSEEPLDIGAQLVFRYFW